MKMCGIVNHATFGAIGAHKNATRITHSDSIHVRWYKEDLASV